MKNNKKMALLEARRERKLIWVMILCGIIIAVLFINLTDAWSSNQFNNSLTNENLTFTGNQNITRYLSIPNSVSALTKGYLNLSGNYVVYVLSNITPHSYFTLDEISGNYSNAMNTNKNLTVSNSGEIRNILGFNGSNSINFTGGNQYLLGLSDTLYDLQLNENWSMSFWIRNINIGVGFEVLAKNYGIGVGQLLDFEPGTGRLVYYQPGSNNIYLGTQNNVIPPTNTWYKYTLTHKNFNTTIDLFINDRFNETIKNLTVYNLEQRTSGAPFYIGKDNFNTPNAYGQLDDIVFYNKTLDIYQNFTSNSSLSIANSKVWNYSGQFNQTNNKTNNLATYINKYLTATYLVGTNYIIPFIFNSATTGILQYLDLIFSNIGFLENSQTSNSTTYETSKENIIFNLSYDASLYSTIYTNLIYNGTSYSTTKIAETTTTYIFSSPINIHLINLEQENKSFYWEIYLTNSTATDNYNTSIYNQTINKIHFENCNSTYPTIAVNISIYDEKDGTTSISSTYKSSLNYYLGDGTITKNNTFNLGSNKSFSFCILPNATYYTNSIIELSSLGYSDRKFYLNNRAYSNNVKNLSLYLSNSTLDSAIIIEIKDEGYTPLEKYLVEIYRKNIETSSYLMVESQETDVFGQFVAHLVENDIRYKFKIYNESGTLKKDTGDVTIACRSSICVVPFIVSEETIAFNRYNDLENYDSDLTFNNVTNIFLYTWNDNTGGVPTHRLEVKRQLLNGTTLICNSSSTALVGTLTCSVGTMKASYTAQGYRSSSPEQRRLVIYSKVGDTTGIFGLEGLMWGFLLTMTMICIGIFNPPVAIILYIVSYLLLGVIGIVYISPAIFIGQLVLGVLFIWAFRS